MKHWRAALEHNFLILSNLFAYLALTLVYLGHFKIDNSNIVAFNLTSSLSYGVSLLLLLGYFWWDYKKSKKIVLSKKQKLMSNIIKIIIIFMSIVTLATILSVMLLDNNTIKIIWIVSFLVLVFISILVSSIDKIIKMQIQMQYHEKPINSKDIELNERIKLDENK